MGVGSRWVLDAWVSNELERLFTWGWGLDLAFFGGGTGLGTCGAPLVGLSHRPTYQMGVWGMSSVPFFKSDRAVWTLCYPALILLKDHHFNIALTDAGFNSHPDWVCNSQ